ncbi:MAG: ABC transporter permease, partial [Oscillospiraceae bacterium]|nr:ABC transporter permease [Oscillospiraceae bacterium]
DMIKEDIQSLMDEYNVEDAQFQTAVELSDDNIQELEKEYSLLVEKTAYMDVESNEKSYRIFSPADKVNKYQLLEGKDVIGEYEVLIDRDFADSNSLSVGDELEIEDESFEIVGLAIRSDYIYSKKNMNDAWVDKENFCMIQLDKKDYEKLLAENSWNETFYYSVLYKNESKISAFRTELYEKYGAYQYLSAEANERIESPKSAGDIIFVEACSLAPILFIVIMIMVSTVIGRMMDKEKKYIGTLTALGYRNREISFHYCIYGIIPGLIGGILGVLLAIVAGKGVAMYFVIDYQMINYDYYIRPAVAVICCLIPVILYGLVVYIKSISVLKKNIVSMLLERDDSDKKRSHMLAKSNMNFRTKFKMRELFAHFGRSVLVVLCMFLSGFLCLFGFSMKDTVDDLMEKGVESAAVYKYAYYLNHIETEDIYEGYHGISATFEMKDGTSQIALNGVPDDSAYSDIELIEGNYQADGYYISNAVSVEHDLHKGDILTIINTVTLEETEIVIDGVSNDNTQQAIITSSDNAAEIIGIPDNSYNVIYSDTALDIDSSEVAYMSDEEGILDTLNTAMSAMNGFIYGMMFMGILMSIISVYLVVNMLIEENKSNISLFKVLGYHNMEINRIVLNTNHILVLIGFIIAVPVAVSGMNILCSLMVSEMHVVMTPAISAISVIICGIIVLLSYIVSLFLLRKKVDKVDMVISLKGNRE